ncbi:MAG: hypothetical protein IPH35_20115 [Rhodoferax sp.]|nr:hypothetical protein [Rhodoferax sp.]
MLVLLTEEMVSRENAVAGTALSPDVALTLKVGLPEPVVFGRIPLEFVLPSSIGCAQVEGKCRATARRGEDLNRYRTGLARQIEGGLSVLASSFHAVAGGQHHDYQDVLAVPALRRN